MLEFKNYIGILYSEKENYIIESKIGSGATCECYKCFSYINQMKYALKLYTEDNINEYLTETQFLSKVKNDNIVRLINNGEGNIRINEKNNNSYELQMFTKNKKKIYFEIIELLEKGEIFDYIYYPSQGFSEDISKIIFSQILNAVEYCHLNNIFHSDIKLENLLLDDNYSIKLIDFSYSKSLNKDELIQGWKGTRCYASPEIIKYGSCNYNGEKYDIFSLGVVLYILVVGKFPFDFAHFLDKNYRNIVNRDFDEFWKKCKVNVSDEYKDLINKIFCNDPDLRLSIYDIKNHKWMNDIGKKEDYLYQKEFEYRKILVEIGKNKRT